MGTTNRMWVVAVLFFAPAGVNAEADPAPSAPSTVTDRDGGRAAPGISAVPALTRDIANGFGLEVSTGLHGGLSFVEGGVIFPRWVPWLTSGFKLTAMSAVNWVTFSNLDSGDTVSLHPVVVGGMLSVGSSSDLMHEFIRVYGGADLLLGTTLTPYDSYFYGKDNLIGLNLTYGLFGKFGIEFLTSDHWATFVEAGGGFQSFKVADANEYAIAASWMGSGVTLKVGTRFYL